MRLHSTPTLTPERADLALRMLQMTRELLDGGRRWHGKKLAVGRFGFTCDPTSRRAHSFSLVGAALRVRWQLHEEIEQCRDEIGIVKILHALAAAPGTAYRGEQDWERVEASLGGLESALRECASAPVIQRTSLQA
jgi:hypothetical protein